jgi:hypothetical protein
MEIAALARTVRLRNLGSWTHDHYDDIACFGLDHRLDRGHTGPRADAAAAGGPPRRRPALVTSRLSPLTLPAMSQAIFFQK